jgi:segregation and condensation protein B
MSAEPERHDENNFYQVLEALIFASDEPLSETVIVEILQNTEFAAFAGETGAIANAIAAINEQLTLGGRPYMIVRVAGGYHFVTRNAYGTFVQRLLRSKSRKRLSQAALETLAIIAYKQPVSKPDIEAIRGVNSNEVVNALLDRALIGIVGRAESIGKPLLYGTTQEFLRIFGLNALDELPKMREIDELLRSQPQAVAAELGSVVAADIVMELDQAAPESISRNDQQYDESN